MVAEPFPRLKRSQYEWENPFFDFVHSGELLARSLRMGGRRAGRLGAIAKVLLILLGALTATKAVADQVAGAESSGVVIAYAVIGVLTSTIAGSLAAFKWEEQSGKLKTLASEVSSWLREFERIWETEVAYADPAKFKAAKKSALTSGAKTLGEFERKASELQIVVERPTKEEIEPPAEVVTSAEVEQEPAD
jgi:hypothetical protein